MRGIGFGSYLALLVEHLRGFVGWTVAAWPATVVDIAASLTFRRWEDHAPAQRQAGTAANAEVAAVMFSGTLHADTDTL